MSIRNTYFWPLAAAGIFLGAFTNMAGAHPTDRIGEQLGLSVEQQESFTALRGEVEVSRTAVHDQSEEVIALVKDGDVDAAADLAADQARERVHQRGLLWCSRSQYGL